MEYLQYLHLLQLYTPVSYGSQCIDLSHLWLNLFLSILLLQINLFSFMYECFACMYMYTPPARLVPMKVRRGTPGTGRCLCVAGMNEHLEIFTEMKHAVWS